MKSLNAFADFNKFLFFHLIVFFFTRSIKLLIFFNFVNTIKCTERVLPSAEVRLNTHEAFIFSVHEIPLSTIRILQYQYTRDIFVSLLSFLFCVTIHNYKKIIPWYAAAEKARGQTNEITLKHQLRKFRWFSYQLLFFGNLYCSNKLRVAIQLEVENIYFS